MGTAREYRGNRGEIAVNPVIGTTFTVHTTETCHPHGNPMRCDHVGRGHISRGYRGDGVWGASNADGNTAVK